jgi:hypothetical protein
MGKACSTHELDAGFCSEDLRGMDYLKERVRWRVLLKWILVSDV